MDTRLGCQKKDYCFPHHKCKRKSQRSIQRWLKHPDKCMFPNHWRLCLVQSSIYSKVFPVYWLIIKMNFVAAYLGCTKCCFKNISNATAVRRICIKLKWVNTVLTWYFERMLTRGHLHYMSAGIDQMLFERFIKDCVWIARRDGILSLYHNIDK